MLSTKISITKTKEKTLKKIKIKKKILPDLIRIFTKMIIIVNLSKIYKYKCVSRKKKATKIEIIINKFVKIY